MAMRAAVNTIPVSPGKAIYQLIVEAQAALKTDRRGEVRYPLFWPVSIELDDGQKHSAYIREVSETGLGLIHNMDLNQSEVGISVRSDRGDSIRVRTRIVWCVSCDKGWYISGGEFAGLASIGQ